jgi:nucleoside-diphosphate-sugar epimerase
MNCQKRVLITGATGFVGAHCLSLLIGDAVGDTSCEVHAVASRPPRPEFLRNGLVWHTADLLNTQHVQSLMSNVRPTHLLHLAWCHTVPGRFWRDADNFRWVQASLALLQAFAAHGGQRAVFTGTCAEYDWNFGYCSEDVTPLRPSTIYGTCKHALQLLVQPFAEQADISMAWARLFFLYGPGEYPERLVASTIQSLRNGDVARCSSGEQIRDFLYVQDAAAALVALLQSTVCGPVNIASGQPVAVREIVHTIAEIMGHSELIQLGALPISANEPPLLVADVRRLHEEVGWKAHTNLRVGLQEEMNWLMTQRE